MIHENRTQEILKNEIISNYLLGDRETTEALYRAYIAIGGRYNLTTILEGFKFNSYRAAYVERVTVGADVSAVKVKEV